MSTFLSRVFSILSISAFASLPVFAHTPALPISTQNSLAPMLKQVMPTIVNISVEKIVEKNLDQLIPMSVEDNTKIPIKMTMVGSGIIFDAKNGYIVTNAHVMNDEKVIIVTLKNGQRYYAKLIAKSKEYDIAVLQIPTPHLTALPFGNSDELQVGDFVTAIGSPFGLSQTVTSGVVSALNRVHPQIEGYQNFIQTDAPINPGNSGGALIDMKGQLVGINTAIVAPIAGNAGIGFAIPSNMAKQVITQLLKYGKVERGALGVIVQNMTPALASTLNLSTEEGALISQVLPDSPGENAGIQPGDLITRVDDNKINSADQLKNMLGLIRPGTSVKLTLIRHQQTQTISATIADPKNLKSTDTPYFSGMQLQDFKELETNGSALAGVMVTKIADRCPGALAGLQAGDVITQINQTPVHTLGELSKATHAQNEPLLLTVVRDDIAAFLVIRAQ